MGGGRLLEKLEQEWKFVEWPGLPVMNVPLPETLWREEHR